MQQLDIFNESDLLADELLEIVDVPLFDDSPKVRVSGVACSLSLEHWHSVRILLRAEFLSSAVAVHRIQFEALVRSVWLLYSASAEHVTKLAATLSIESELAAKNIPLVADMMRELEKTAPTQAHESLSRFKEASWGALNSYVHAGIHAIRRHYEGHPPQLLHNVLRSANGLAVVSCMQAAVLAGQQPLQRKLLEVAGKHPACVPSMLDS